MHTQSQSDFDPLRDVQAGGGPGMRSFVYGHLAPEAFPIAELIAASERALREGGSLALQYGPEQGYGPLIDCLRDRIRRDEGPDLGREHLTITAGCAGALDAIARLFTQPGDTMLVEAPTYSDTLHIFRDHGLRLFQVPVDEDGLIVERVAQLLEELRRTGERPKFLYTIANFQNPTGVTLSVERRRQLIALARAHDIKLIEDDVYRDLCYEGDVPPSLFALDGSRETVIRVGSFSKILAPGLRLGWVTAEPRVIENLAHCGLRSMGGGANPFASHVVAAFCARGLLEPHIACLREVYRTRRDAALDALSRSMPPGVTWTHPRGGFFVWLTLPASLLAREVIAAAEQRGVTCLPGDLFFAESGGEHNLRLAFSYLSAEDVTQGIAALGDAIRSLLG
ncbi:MAG: PLP-dependent aminotransferase family protein [Chloroflexota bacterium]|nr:PLP-dependent aminotransferase family protein [Chloroflexota bacterium]